MKRGMILIVLAIGLLAGCSKAASPAEQDTPVGKQVPVVGGSYTDVSPQELNDMLASKDFTFVNVHIPFEGNIPDTDLSIPYDQIGNRVSELPSDKDAKIVLYCRSDHMSRIAAETLVKSGFTNIYNLEGGFAAWEVAGYPVEQ